MTCVRSISVTANQFIKSSNFLTLDWPSITQVYKSLEISPYIWRARHELLWYNAWDVASGCIWDISCITKISFLEEVEISKNDLM